MFKRYLQRLERKCHTTIDSIPVYNWWKIHDTKDLSYLYLVKKPIVKSDIGGLAVLWKRLYDEYLKRFGIGEKAVEIIEKQREVIQLIKQIGVDNDNDMLTYLDIAKQQLQTLEVKAEKQGDFSHYEFKGRLERALKISIDPKKVSVEEYYSYLKILEDGRE